VRSGASSGEAASCGCSCKVLRSECVSEFHCAMAQTLGQARVSGKKMADKDLDSILRQSSNRERRMRERKNQEGVKPSNPFYIWGPERYKLDAEGCSATNLIAQLRTSSWLPVCVCLCLSFVSLCWPTGAEEPVQRNPRESVSLLPLTCRTRARERRRGLEPLKVFLLTVSGKSAIVELESALDFIFFPLMLVESWMQ
jgi:hypothetical protein